MSFFYKIFLIFIFSFYLTVGTFAAIGPEELPELKEKVYYNISPTRPSIGDNVEIDVEMYGAEIKNSNFVWKIAGRIVQESVGGNRLKFVLSEKTTVEVKITTGNSVVIGRSFDFDPKKIIIVWESKTNTPPFYKGKPFYSKESNLILNAINIDQPNPLTNVYNNYTWKVDSTVKGKDSGVGYSSYVHKGDILGLEPLFTVTMSGISSAKDKAVTSYESQSQLRVQAFTTEIFTYEKSPLLGVLFNKMVKTQYKLNKSEATIVSYPVNYSLSSSLSGIYEWYINDVKINSNSNELSFKRTRDNDQSRLTLKIDNVNAILQSKTVSYIVDTTR